MRKAPLPSFSILNFPFASRQLNHNLKIKKVIKVEIKPIAYIYTDFEEKFGIPRQSGRVPELTGQIVFEPDMRNPDCIRGIEEFSHLWLIFGFSKAESGRNCLTVRPPRLGGNKRVGVFASRSPFRPNGLGLSCVKLLNVEKEKGIINVSGIDVLSGTPIYDIKPYLPYSDSYPEAEGSFGEELKDYSLEVDFPNDLLEKIPQEKRKVLISCLSEDPRPSYHDDDRKYSMSFAGFDVHFKVCGNVLYVVGVDNLKI